MAYAARRARPQSATGSYFSSTSKSRKTELSRPKANSRPTTARRRFEATSRSQTSKNDAPTDRFFRDATAVSRADLKRHCATGVTAKSSVMQPPKRPSSAMSHHARRGYFASVQLRPRTPRSLPLHAWPDSRGPLWVDTSSSDSDRKPKPISRRRPQSAMYRPVKRPYDSSQSSVTEIESSSDTDSESDTDSFFAHAARTSYLKPQTTPAKVKAPRITSTREGATFPPSDCALKRLLQSDCQLLEEHLSDFHHQTKLSRSQRQPLADVTNMGSDAGSATSATRRREKVCLSHDPSSSVCATIESWMTPVASLLNETISKAKNCSSTCPDSATDISQSRSTSSQSDWLNTILNSKSCIDVLVTDAINRAHETSKLEATLGSVELSNKDLVRSNKQLSKALTESNARYDRICRENAARPPSSPVQTRGASTFATNQSQEDILQAKLHHRDTEIARLAHANAGLSKKVGSLRTELEKRRERCRELEDELSRVQSEHVHGDVHGSLVAKCDRAAVDLKKAKSAQRVLSVENHALKLQQNVSKRRITDLEVAKRALEEKLAESEKEHEVFVEASTASLEAATKELGETVASLDGARAEFAKIRTVTAEELRLKTTQASVVQSELEARLLQAQNRERALAEKLSAAESQIASLSRSLERSSAEARRQASRIQELEKKLQNAEQAKEVQTPVFSRSRRFLKTPHQKIEGATSDPAQKSPDSEALKKLQKQARKLANAQRLLRLEKELAERRSKELSKEKDVLRNVCSTMNERLVMQLDLVTIARGFSDNGSPQLQALESVRNDLTKQERALKSVQKTLFSPRSTSQLEKAEGQGNKESLATSHNRVTTSPSAHTLSPPRPSLLLAPGAGEQNAQNLAIPHAPRHSKSSRTLLQVTKSARTSPMHETGGSKTLRNSASLKVIRAAQCFAKVGTAPKSRPSVVTTPLKRPPENLAVVSPTRKLSASPLAGAVSAGNSPLPQSTPVRMVVTPGSSMAKKSNLPQLTPVRPNTTAIGRDLSKAALADSSRHTFHSSETPNSRNLIPHRPLTASGRKHAAPRVYANRPQSALHPTKPVSFAQFVQQQKQNATHSNVSTGNFAEESRNSAPPYVKRPSEFHMQVIPPQIGVTPNNRSMSNTAAMVMRGKKLNKPLPGRRFAGVASTPRGKLRALKTANTLMRRSRPQTARMPSAESKAAHPSDMAKVDGSQSSHATAHHLRPHTARGVPSGGQRPISTHAQRQLGSALKSARSTLSRGAFNPSPEFTPSKSNERALYQTPRMRPQRPKTARHNQAVSRFRRALTNRIPDRKAATAAGTLTPRAPNLSGLDPVDHSNLQNRIDSLSSQMEQLGARMDQDNLR